MSTSPLLQLAPGVKIVSVSDLPEEVAAQLHPADGSFAVSICSTRQTTSLVDSATAELLREFEEPSSLAGAVQRYAGRLGESPSRVFDQARGFLESMLRRGILLGVDDPRRFLPPPLAAGDSVSGWTVVRPLQRLEDCEVCLVRSETGRLGVVKIRTGDSATDHRTLAGEAEVLAEIRDLAPPLLEVGELEGRPYLVSEWFPGIDVESWARKELGFGSESLALDLLRNIAGLYAGLHDQGFLHGDVHPRNLLIDRQLQVRMLDFGLAVRIDGPTPYRGGVPFYRAPEIARALLRGESPALSVASEQFSVAALLVRLFTGEHYRDFALEEKTQLRQVAEGGMCPFRQRGLPSWPALESVLQRALDPDPGGRFLDLRSFAAALAQVKPEPFGRRDSVEPSPLAAARERFREGSAPGGAWWREELPPPVASVQNGAAGVAYACYRLAVLEDDADWLHRADLWIRRARHHIERADAFVAPELDLTTATVGQGSPQHGESGVHGVEALIAHAACQADRRDAAIGRYLEAIERPLLGLDLTRGLSSLLVTSASLLRLVPGGPLRSRLEATGEKTLRELWSALDEEPEIRFSHLDNLGLAHGWAGFLFASLRWLEARDAEDRSLPGAWARRLEQWAEMAEPWGRGLRWPWHQGPSGCFESSMPGWCNGTAGHLLLACAVTRVDSGSAWQRLLEGAAMDVWDASRPSANLCCGQVGRAYALLSAFRATGDATWLRKASRLAELAAKNGAFDEGPPNSLFKGELGLALLGSELEHPEVSAFPWIESEGW